MNWKDLVNVLERQVPAGSVTTYAQVSLWEYGVSHRNHSVRSLLVGARNHGYQQLTNRVVGVDGKLADLLAGPDQQRLQLLNEGVRFTVDGRVDLTKTIPVVFSLEWKD